MNYAEKVLPLLRETREISLPHWGKAEIINQKDETSASVVTKLDIAIEKFIAPRLKELYPDIAFVGEEQGGDRNAKKFWLMDPIDGTSHYVRGSQFCTTMLALIDNGEVVFSAIYHFVTDDMYYAVKGGGAFCNDRRLQVSNRSLKDAYICCEARLRKPEDQELFFKLRSKTVLLTTISAGWEFCQIADGKLDARINLDPWGNDYDFAPCTLLVTEAGGIVANLNSSRYDYRNTELICTNQKIYQELTTGPSALFPIK